MTDIEQIKKGLDDQINDEGLWFIAKTAPEAYLQQELRKCHTWIEKLIEQAGKYEQCMFDLDGIIDERDRAQNRIKELEAEWIQAIGWGYAYACSLADEGRDIRKTLTPDMLAEAQKDFKK